MKKQELILRTCGSDMRSYGGFEWPESGRVECKDWDSVTRCGGGLHGLLRGRGNWGLTDNRYGAKWMVVAVKAGDIVDLGDKVKFPSGEVIYCSEDIFGAIEIIGGYEYFIYNGANQRINFDIAINKKEAEARDLVIVGDGGIGRITEGMITEGYFPGTGIAGEKGHIKFRKVGGKGRVGKGGKIEIEKFGGFTYGVTDEESNCFLKVIDYNSLFSSSTYPIYSLVLV